MISPKDDQFHKRTSDPYWNESSWFGFQLPERDLGGWVYCYHRPNMNYTVGGVAFWDPSGDQPYNCRYYDFGDIYPMAPGTDMHDFSLPNGLRVARDEPLKSFDFSYQGPEGYQARGCQMDLRWEATKEPHATGNPTGTREWGLAKGHFEQPGRITGTVEIAGDRFEVSALSLRDHSWGPRTHGMQNRGHFTWGLVDEDTGFVVFSGCDIPDRDSIFGMTDPINAGWYLKDGEYGSLESGQITTTERGEDGRPLRVEITARDHLGRTLQTAGRAKNMLAWQGYPFMLSWWAQFEWDLDGRTAYGEEQDFQPLQHQRYAVRQHRALIWRELREHSSPTMFL
jgi:hypothetical protein